MWPDPIARLNLTAPVFSDTSAGPEPPAPVQDFPAEVSTSTDLHAQADLLPASSFTPEPLDTPFGAGAGRPGATLEDAIASIVPLPLSALERYRLENDREQLRKRAYQRVFLNGR